MNLKRPALFVAPLLLLLALAALWLLLEGAAPAAPGTALATPSAGAGTLRAAPSSPPSAASQVGDPTPGSSPPALGTLATGPGRARISGRVLQAEGTPLASATVALKRLAVAAEAEYDDWGGMPALEHLDEVLPPLDTLELETVLTSTTDADGRFLLDLHSSPADDRWSARWLIVTHPQHLSVAANLYTSLPEALELEVQLPLAASLELSLRGPAGEALEEPRLVVVADYSPLLPIPARGLEFRPMVLSKRGGPRTHLHLDAEAGRFSQLPPGPLQASGAASGYAVASRPMSLGAGETASLSLELTRGRRLLGRVREGSGGPVPEVSVGFWPVEEEEPPNPDQARSSLVSYLEATTDAVGAFELSGLEDCAYTVSVEAEGFARWETTLRANERELQVVLTRLFELRGRLPAGAAPGRAQISLVEVGAGPNHLRLTAIDAGEEFTFEGLAPGRYLLSAASAGRATLVPLEVVVDRNLSGLEVPLEAGLEVTLLVRDAQGGPLAGATADDADGLSSPGFGASQPFWEGETDAEGRLRIDGLAPGEHRMRVVKPGYASASVLFVVGSGRAPAAQEVVLERGASFEALLREGGGRLEGGSVLVRHLQDPQRSRQLRTGDDGYLRLKDLAPGTYRLEVDLESGPATFGTLTLRAGESRKVELQAQPWGRGRIFGRVLRGQTPAPGTRVWISGGLAPDFSRLEFTDAEGSFAIEGLAAASYRVHVHGGPALQVALAPGESAQLQLAVWEASVAGTLLLSTGDPAPAGLVLALVSSSTRDVLSAACDARGAFHFEAVPPGTSRLVVRTPFGVAQSAPFSLGPREQLADLRLRLEAPGRLEVQVLRADGSPAAGVAVSLFHRELGAYAGAGGAVQASEPLPHTTDPQGILRLRDLLPGVYALHATSATRAQVARAELQVSAEGDPVRHTLTLAQPADLRVLAPEGATLWVSFAGARLRTAGPAPKEGALFAGLPATRVEVSGVTAGGEPLGPRTLELEAGSQAALDLR